MKLRLAAIALLAAAASVAGCRRADIREFTVDLPGLTAENQPLAAKALATQGGIFQDSLQWDLEKKTLTLKYDSMLTAKTNIRMAIEGAGVKVAYPEKTGPAGYINTRE